MAIQEIHKYLLYNADTGIFTWKKKYARNIKVGKQAGCNDDGYISITFRGVKYRGHHLAWYFAYGSMPKIIDHINHNRSDNRLNNLREATYLENNRNASKQKRNTSGTTGVFWCKQTKRWRATIVVDRKNIHLGRFEEYSDAVNARKNAEVLYGFHENHGISQIDSGCEVQLEGGVS